MRICIVGCGAMGSIYAALLASADHEVAVIDPYTAHIDAINSQGLRVWGASGDRTVFLPAAVDADQLNHLAPPDLVVCAVKAGFVQSALPTLDKLTGAQTRLLTIQNGLGSAQAIAEHLGAERLIVGIAQGFGASLTAPGTAHHNSMKAIRMGAYDSLAQDQVEEIAMLWRHAGFDAQAEQDIVAMQWSKLICNVAYSAPCAIAGLTVGEVLQHPQMQLLSRAAAYEAHSVARALNVNLPFADVDQQIHQFAQGMPDAKPSVLIDIEHGRPSEIDVINGAIATAARKVGLDAPINAALTTLVKALEATQN